MRTVLTMKKLFIALFLLSSTWMMSQQAAAVEIAMVLWRGETPAEKQFVQELANLGIKANIQIFNAEQDRGKLGTMLRKDLQPKLGQVDYVYTFGTTVSKVVKGVINGESVQIFNIVTDPVGADLVANLNQGQAHINGVTSAVSLERQVENALEMVKVSKVAVPFNPREKNSKLFVDNLKAIGEREGFTVTSYRIRPEDSTLQEDLDAMLAAGNMDAIFMPPDSFLISNAATIMAKINEKKIPTVCAVKKYVDEGCLMGTVSDYGELGKMAARMLHEHMAGKSLNALPVQSDRNAKRILNDTTRAMLGL